MCAGSFGRYCFRRKSIGICTSTRTARAWPRGPRAGADPDRFSPETVAPKGACAHESLALRPVRDDGAVREVHRRRPGGHVGHLVGERRPETGPDRSLGTANAEIRARVLALPPGGAARRCDQACRETEPEPRGPRGGRGSLRGEAAAT